ncbi:MAG: hypothetical protein WAV41_05960 [Microgenomates group bacterium]
MPAGVRVIIGDTQSYFDIGKEREELVPVYSTDENGITAQVMSVRATPTGSTQVTFFSPSGLVDRMTPNKMRVTLPDKTIVLTGIR